MSLFKNRIPKNSVSFSEETYELQFPRPASLALADSFPYVTILAGREVLHDQLVILPLLFEL
ncbi:hypothetical protein ACT4UM_22430, partial [Bacillus sp. SS-TM]